MNLNFLLGAGGGGVELPDPAAEMTRGYSLSNLARQNRAGAQDEQDKARMRQAQIDAAQGLALAQSQGWDSAIQQTMQKNPDAGSLLLKLRKDDEGAQIDRDYKRAQTGKLTAETANEGMSAKEKGVKIVGSMASAIAQSQGPITEMQAQQLLAQARHVGTPKEILDLAPNNPDEFKQWATGLAAAATDPKAQAEIWKIRTETPAHVAQMQGAARSSNASADAAPINAQSSRISANASAQQAGTSAQRLAFDREKETRMGGRADPAIMNMELKLGDDYRAQSKGFVETAGALNKAKAALATADTNPGSALAAGTAFMKILDPNSVVRESELGMALNASGWFDRAANIAQTMKSGKVMTPQQKDNLGAAIDDLWAEATSVQRKVDSTYGSRVKQYGGAPERVLMDLGQNDAPTPKASAGGGAVFKKAPAGSGVDYVYTPKGR